MDVVEAGEDLEGVELSLNAIEGLSEPKILKLRGELLGRMIVVMIDCGATHNFVSPQLIQTLGLPISETKPYVVLIGNGERHQSKGICRHLHLQIGDFKVIEDFLPMSTGSSNVILGMK